MTDGALLSVTDLRVEFGTERGTVYAVNGISFEVSNGETLGIVGESGCGKSVTSLALLGLLARTGRVTSGEAMFDGRDLLQMSDGDLRKIRGKDDRDDLSGSDVEPQPGAHGRAIRFARR